MGKFLRSVVYAARGVRMAIAGELSLRIHLVVTILTIITGFLLKLDVLEWCLIIIAMGLVWFTELINTAVETLCDMVSPDIHPMIGKTKDIAAGAVLIASITSSLIGLLVFGGKLLHILS
ncbi:MAG: diacylglycerol kinase family protein [Bacteroidetes bacterium]|nr:diacylglycerol kinase family protein [Bacteroidota bacterium]